MFIFTLSVSPVSKLQISVRHKNNFIEVNESFTIFVSNDKNVTFGEYTYDLGDGSPAFTTDRDFIHHSYSQYGYFKLVAIIYSRCRNETLHVSARVSIEKPVVLLGNLTLLCDPVPFPSPLKAFLTLNQGTDFKCYWKFSHRHQAQTTFAEQGLKHNVTYSFNSTGNYSLSVECVNRLSNANILTQVAVQIPVKGLLIDPIKPKALNREFKVTWHVQSGSDVDYTASFAGKELITFTSPDNTGGWAWVRHDQHAGPGIHDVIVTATNQVSGILRATERIRVEREVEPFLPVVISSNGDIEVNETFVLFTTKVNSENNVNPVFSIDLGDGRGVVKTETVYTNISYSNYGDFLVTINASNNVSFYNTSLLIKIYKPVLLIEHITLITEPTVLFQPTVINVVLTRVSDLVCNVSFNDIPNYSKIFDLRKESFWDPVRRRTDTPSNPPNVTFLIERNYTEVGIHSVTVACRNRLSENTATTEVVVQEPVTGACCIPNDTIAFGNPVNISLQISTGTNASFEVLFNGYKFSHVITGLSAFVIVEPHMYGSAGLHRFTITIWNLVSPPFLIAGHVIVEFPISGLQAYLFGGPRDVEVNESVKISASLTNGSDPEFLFNFNDGSEVMVTQNSEVDHKFNPHAFYVVNVTARNNVSQEIVLLNITIVKPVLPIKGLLVGTLPTAVNNITKLNLNLLEGSDFNCYWQMGDGFSLNTSYHHLSFYIDGKTADKRPFQNQKHFVQHNYSSTGVFHISVRCQNRLGVQYASAEIVIQSLVKGLKIPRMPTQVVGQEFQVYWSLLSGTNATFKVSLPGAKIISIRTYELGGFLRVLVPSSGKYVISVEAQNMVSPIQATTAVIEAEVPVSNLTVSVAYDSRDLEVNQNVTFTASVTTGATPMYLFDFGDGNKLENNRGDATHRYNYYDTYRKKHALTYEASVTASNNVSTVMVSSINVTVYRPVLPLQRVKLSTYPSNVSEQARIALAIEQGSDFTCNCGFADGETPQQLPLPEVIFLGSERTPMETFSNLRYQISHVYHTPSKNQVFIECKNRLSKATSTKYIIIQEPITALKVYDISLLRFNESFVIYWEIVNGTDVEFEISFANFKYKTSGGSRNMTITQNDYEFPGAFQVSVVARNLVSWAVAKTTVVIQHPVYIQDVIARLPLPGGSGVGYGIRGDYFPAGRDVMFKVFAQGTNLSCQWEIDKMRGEFTSKAWILHKFHRVGSHQLSVMVKNMVSLARANISVVIQYTIEGPALQSSSPQRLNQPVKFHLSAAQLGTNSCFAVDFGDGNSSLYGHQGCKLKNRTSNFQLISAVESVKFEHAYNQVGGYFVTLNASNFVSFVQVDTNVEIVYAPCTSPTIAIENLGLSSSTASESFRTDPYTVRTYVQLECERTNKVRFQWKVLSLNENGVQSNHRGNIILTQRELSIPRKGLKYGLYEVHFTTQMALPDTDKYSSTTMGYLKILPSPLTAKINGGNLISRGFGRKIKIDAAQSKDPDMDPGEDSGE